MHGLGVQKSLDAARKSAYATESSVISKGSRHKKRAGPIAGPFTRKRRYCLTGALDDAAAGVFEAFTAFLFATLLELAGFAVVGLAAFLAVFFLETGAVLFVVEVCGVTGALDCGVLCANIAAADIIAIKIERFIFVSPFAGCFRSPLANPSCGHMRFGTLASAGDGITPPCGIPGERLLMKKR
jgi:hypothetical protein